MVIEKEVDSIMLSPEQERQAKLDNFINERTKFSPEPTYFFKVGDRVEIGSLKDVVVCAIINDKVYEIDYTHISGNYVDPIIHKHQKKFVAWYDIRPYKETYADSLIKNADIRLNYNQVNLASLLSKAYYFGTNFNPEYQREYVWNLDDNIALIDSIFNNVDIGKFVFIHKEYSDKYIYEILDGKQRIRAILDFYENRFAYNGLFFNDLCLQDRHYFKEYPVSIAEIENCDKKQILRYFIKLNKHGRVMDKKQIEKVEKMIEEIE